MSAAMNDSIRSLPGEMQTYRARRAAVAGAASAVLSYLYPVEREWTNALARRTLRLARRQGNRTAVVSGWRVGRRIGERAVARARDDGAGGTWTGTVPLGPGYWEPTLPSFGGPLEPLAGTWRTWNLNRASQYRPPPPPAYGSELFKAEAQEVYDTSAGLTAEQRRIATRWAGSAGTVTPPGLWNNVALRLIEDSGLGSRRAALVLAALNTAQADAFIACWDAKYTYWSVRPVTVLRRGFDRGWLPYLETPPFPSYVSGHSATSAAAARVLSHLFPASALRLHAWAREAAVSRLYAGIHFRSDNEAGLAMGEKVGSATVRRLRAGTRRWVTFAP